jgi:aminopeptidase N
MYERLIGPYPYAKFALVENFWETGYGMPSFTLLGPRVIRLPFIPYTSYPHEILHNWWGNGVYVDFASGNWSEGLTAYLADHLLKEQRGQGADYRRAALQKYADYVGENKDFRLTEFRGRHSSVTEAVGYGKTMMVFHMLRRHLGDAVFVKGLRRFYKDNAFRVAAWSELRAAFNAVSDEPLDDFFDQWTLRTGAPELRLRDAVVEPVASGFRLRAVLEQTQDETPYALRVPVAVQLEGREQALVQDVVIGRNEQALELELPARPLSLAVDPSFDLFRRLHREEIPPAISQALGGDRVLMVLPSAAPEALREAYAELVRSWQRGRDARLELRLDDELERLPANPRLTA